MSAVICQSPYLVVDVHRTTINNRVRISADVGGPMHVGFELPADKAEELGRKLIELAQAAQAAKTHAVVVTL